MEEDEDEGREEDIAKGEGEMREGRECNGPPITKHQQLCRTAIIPLAKSSTNYCNHSAQPPGIQ
jgi:hypothetical protein